MAFEEWAAVERLSGEAPPGRLIDDTLVQVADDIDVITEAAERCGLDRLAVLCAGELIDVDVELSVPWAAGRSRRPRPARFVRLVDQVGRIADGVICRLGYRRPRSGLLIAAAIDLAAAVLATGDAGWRALTVTRAAQGNGSAECTSARRHRRRSAGRRPSACWRRPPSCTVAALRGAVPVFETTTRRLYDDGFVDEDELVGTDYRRRRPRRCHQHFVWGDITVGELIALSPSPAELAQAIWGSIHALASGRQGRRLMAAAAFDLTGPLPSGRTLIEASAGTGKTYSIAALVTRFVAGDLAHHDLAEGVDIDEVLVVTYTRAAAAELRDRIRAKLKVAADYLDGAALPSGDEWLVVFDAGSPRVRQRRSAADPRGPGPLRRGDDHHDPRLLPAGLGPEWSARRRRGAPSS